MLVPFVLPSINIGLYYRVKGYVHFFEIIFRGELHSWMEGLEDKGR